MSVAVGLRRPWIECGLLLLLCLVDPGAASGGERGAQGTALEGLEAVGVVVANFDADQRAAGFRREAFQTKTELKLRMAGLRVLSAEEWFSVPSKPMLYVSVKTQATAERRIASFSVHVRLMEFVVASRTGRKAAVIWELDKLGQGHAEHVLNVLDATLDEFLGDWLKANPREGPEED